MAIKSHANTSHRLSDAQRNALCNVLSRHGEVVCAYLFGSAAAENMGPLSDVDIGVLLKHLPDSSDALVALETELSRIFPERTVDLVSLSSAPFHLAYRIIRDGQLLVNKDPVLKESFEVRAITGFLDFKPMRDMLFQGVSRAIRGAV